MRRNLRGGLFTSLLFAFLLIALVLIGSSMTASAELEERESSQIDIRLDGPSFIGASLEADFQLRIKYVDHPERILNYSYKAELTGSNIAGASLTPNNGTSEDGLFFITITGPIRSNDDLTVKITAYANETEISRYRVKEIDIPIVKPVEISTILYNVGDQDATYVTVQLLVDGDLKDEKVYDVPAGGSVHVSFNWTFSSISNGEHILTLVADSDDGVVEFSEGNNVLEKTIYYSTSGNPIRGALSIVIMFVVIVLVLTVLQKSGPRPKKK
ncbi:MAG TPA: hypothetical protein ENN25_06875 [Euryarchaeota archaeon]|nr:hypothetical protein [Euryarchaeota archaeon]